MSEQNDLAGYAGKFLKDLSTFKEKDFLEYWQKAKESGYEFLLNGMTVTDAALQELDPKLSNNEVRFYGNFSKRLHFVSGEWKIWQGAGLIPDFRIYPLAVTKEVFAEEMKKNGVSDEVLQSYFDYQPAYGNF